MGLFQNLNPAFHGIIMVSSSSPFESQDALSSGVFYLETVFRVTTGIKHPGFPGMVKSSPGWCGWALPLWKMMDFVSWEYDIPNIWDIKFMFQTTNQIDFGSQDVPSPRLKKGTPHDVVLAKVHVPTPQAICATIVAGSFPRVMFVGFISHLTLDIYTINLTSPGYKQQTSVAWASLPVVCCTSRHHKTGTRWTLARPESKSFGWCQARILNKPWLNTVIGGLRVTPTVSISDDLPHGNPPICVCHEFTNLGLAAWHNWDWCYSNNSILRYIQQTFEHKMG